MAFEENPEDYCRDEVCPACPWGNEIKEPIIYKLFHYIALQNAGCPLDRNELRDEHWALLGIIKAEQEKIILEEAKAKRGRNGSDSD